MPEFVQVPAGRLATDVLNALLEEYASRDGTDYGERELSLAEKVANLQRQLENGELSIVYETGSEQWDLLPAEQLTTLIDE